LDAWQNGNVKGDVDIFADLAWLSAVDGTMCKKRRLKTNDRVVAYADQMRIDPIDRADQTHVLPDLRTSTAILFYSLGELLDVHESQRSRFRWTSETPSQNGNKMA
jgi:hypothetical protein